MNCDSVTYKVCEIYLGRCEIFGERKLLEKGRKVLGGSEMGSYEPKFRWNKA